jgi:hypothetical protein
MKLPALSDRLQGRGGPGGWLHRRPKAQRTDTTERLCTRGGGGSRGLTTGGVESRYRAGPGSWRSLG